MTGLFGTLNTGTKGMHASQTALQTTSHNLANSNTDGYTRQRVTSVADLPMTVPGIGQLGTGVLINSIDRVTDNYLIGQVQKESSVLKRYEQKSAVLGQLEAIYNEPSSTGLNAQMSKVFAAWTNLASNPEMGTAKTMVVQQTNSFTDTIHHMSSQIDELHDETVFEMEKHVLDFNSTLEQLDSLNQQIFNISVKGQTPNDLLDQRDRLVGKLNEVAGVDVKTDKFNRVSVKLDGQDILTEKGHKSLAVVTESNEEGIRLSQGGNASEMVNMDPAPAVGTLFIKDGEDYKQIETTSGYTKGSQEALEVLDKKKEELDAFAHSFATEVNNIYGTEPPFFDIPAGEKGAAQAIKVTDAIKNDPSIIQAGKPTADDTVSEGDGSLAQEIAALQHKKVDGMTLPDKYNNSVTDMGIIKQQSDNMGEMQGDLVGLLNQRLQSMAGVDMNEEVVDMIRYQSAFQANSRVISVISDMLDTLINRTGV